MDFQPTYPVILNLPKCQGLGEEAHRGPSNGAVQLRQRIMALHGISPLPSVCDVGR